MPMACDRQYVSVWCGMAAEERLGPEDWCRAGLRELAAGGIDAVRVEPLARRLKITKGSFYWHFVDRRALLDAMLARWEARHTLEIIDKVEAHGGNASDRLLWLFEQVVDNDGRLETAVRAWAASDPTARRVVRRVDRRRLDYLEALLRDVGLPKPVAVARARFGYYAVIGEFTMGATASRADRRAAARLNHAMIVSRA
jgi:AcrR family transcriptional regulator